MTTQEKVQHIRKACIAANPSITDLIFGCRFMGRASSDTYEDCLVFENWKEKNKTIRCLGTLGNQCIWEVDHIKIIGREIRLTDILLAIGNKKIEIMKAQKEQDGVLISKELSEVLFLWDFKNDSLSYHAEHKPEVIDFIYSILS